MHSLEIVPEESRIVSEPVIDWFMMEYLSDHVIDLTVSHKDLSEDGVYGWCYKESNEEFLIEIHNDLDLEEYLITLFHELVHVWQHVTCRPLLEGEANLMSWRLLDKYIKSD